MGKSEMLSIGRDPITDKHLRPLSGWEMTGKVPIGKIGPGCPVGCIYCNQMGMDRGETGEKLAPYISFIVDGGISLNTRLMVGSKVERTIGIKPLVAELKHNPLYSSVSPILLENFNDPGNNWNHAADLIDECLTELHHEGPFVLITKMGIKQSEVDRLIASQREHGAKIIGIVTYAGMPKGIEKSKDHIRVGTMKKLHDAGIPTILSMRPLIASVNDSEENIKRILEETRGIADAVICGGLFVFDAFTIRNFVNAGYTLPDEYQQDIYSLAKTIPIDYKTIVKKIAREIGYPAVVHSHTTCAVTDLTTQKYNYKKPDRFPHWFSHNDTAFCDCGHCPAVQKQECLTAYSTPFEMVASKAITALNHIGYPHLSVEEHSKVPKLLLVKGGALSYEELAYIREQSGWYVDNLPNREGFLWRAKSAIEMDLTFDDKKLKYEDVIAGEFLVGQEWHVILKTSDERLNNIALRWLRSRVRNRVQGITVADVKRNGVEYYADQLANQSNGELTNKEVDTILSQFINQTSD